ncbi:MAG: cytochrome c [Planctomycetota bacterium]|nr:cytochrome c [Planctomycetota bacterium]
MQSSVVRPLIFLGLWLSVGLASAQDAPDGQALFLANCARCHGVEGDGQGEVVTATPARSFKAGGFSFGDTEEAILRTLRSGIPGTEMPGFEGAYSEKQEQAIIHYVLSLLPERRVSTFGERVVLVGEEAVMVRGHLPPLMEDLPLRPRGLLLGLPGGVTFEYRTDDVRLLALRAGDFVDRQEWEGRGGSTLHPLGAVRLLEEGGDPEAMFTLDGRSLACQLRATWVEGGTAGLTYGLMDGSVVIGEVLESLEVLDEPEGGIRRRLEIYTWQVGIAVRFAELGGSKGWLADSMTGELSAFDEIQGGAVRRVISGGKATRDGKGTIHIPMESVSDSKIHITFTGDLFEEEQS